MSCSPTTGISRLSLEDLPSAIPSQRNQMQTSRQEDFGREPHGEGDDSMEEDEEGTVQSPTKLKYNLDHLSSDTQKLVRSLWGETFEEPPQISLQWCDRMLDQDGNLDFYAFQLHEVVPRSVRIGSPKSKFPEPECQCKLPKPCTHLIWLSDCIARQVLHDHDPREPLTLNARGYPNELGEPLFQSISDMRLDILADGLHCDVGHPLSRNSPSPQKVADAHAIVASIAEADEHVFDSYRCDLSSPDFKSSQLVHRKDAEATLFSLLLASHRLSTWLRSGLRPSDPPQNAFIQLESRAFHIFSDLDAYLSPASSFSSTDTDTSEGPRDIPWAAQSVKRCVSQIKALIAHTETPLSPQERSSAARALVRILRGVVDRKDLHERLVHDGFVSDSLELLVDQTQYVDEIQDIMASIGLRGAPAAWVAEMEAVLARMRTNRRSSTTATRASSYRRAGRQRVASPETGPAERGESGETSAVGLGIVGYGASAGASASVSTSASTTGTGVRFLDPETPITAAHAAASRGGRGGRGRAQATTAGGSSGGAGSKRSGGGTPSERGSKRAR